MRAADPAALGAWYRDCLGLDADENGLWRQEAGPTVFATFESGTDYFGSRAQQAMLNFRVRDLDAMLAQLRAKGADVAERRRTWRASAGSAGSPIPRAIGSSCGSPPDRVFTQAVTCWWPTRLPGCELWSGPRGHVQLRLLRAVTGDTLASLSPNSRRGGRRDASPGAASGAAADLLVAGFGAPGTSGDHGEPVSPDAGDSKSG